jgi:RHS repeat-associated protein
MQTVSQRSASAGQRRVMRTIGRAIAFRRPVRQRLGFILSSGTAWRRRGTGAKYSTTTDYVFNGDTLVSTIDQQLASGVATGSAKTRFTHPDHLGSTNVVTDASGTVVQTLDYYPYGSTRISSGQNAESRQYIGQFNDQSTLSYLNARYYDGSRGQFLSQDPTFLAVGNPGQQQQLSQQDQQKFLADPQQINSYSYAKLDFGRF